jgi:two-component system NtrC family sensor kinase
VIEAESGRQALELARQVPSAILLDVKLPDILGYEVCRRLKSNPRTSHIPVLQLSAAFVDNESRVYALESGADAHLTQPVEPNVLIATVKSLVKLHEAESLAKLAAKQWQSTFDALGEGVAIIDAAGNISVATVQ